ncbi:dATP/dGTP pyrophosphohydrolase domain-containing protein, partial [Klebsiella pneumoniae]|uniref:dATP/dGTP pyrophosphohydrolase domain-containing protein n=1 Tax=Klebsiella pneumoniae TaxID=573 RepID=UPI001E30EB63
EAAAEPGDLSEWADMQFLMWDAQRRAGITDAQITQAMIDKLAVNKQREWPEPKDGEPRLHIKEQPASVVPDAYVRDEHGRMMLNGVCEPKIGFGTGWNACRATMLQASPVCTCPSGGGSLRWPCPVHAGSSPVIPDGYVLVPMRLTAENGAKGALSGEFSETKFVNCPECFGDDECETCDGSGRIEITVPVTWTTIKEIWAKGVEHFAAAPQEVKGE